MHKNNYWLLFVCLLLLTTLWFTGKAVYRAIDYSRFSEKSKLSELSWKYEALSGESFIPIGKYAFTFKGKSYTGETALTSLTYRNAWAVQQDHQQLSKIYPQVWLDPKNPSHSTLQKMFPLKESISALIMCGLCIYFIGLGYYVAKREKG